MDFLMAAFPLVLLVGLTTYKKGVPSYYALPLVACLLYVLQLFYFRENPTVIHASVLAGLLSAGTPLLILLGAIFFFKTMEAAGSLALIRAWLNGISPHPVAQLILIGWAFSFFIEGISGFGTPAVMAAPLLVSLGFPPFKAAVLCLTMNTIPVSFGAVGTPMWFGFGELALSNEVLREISFKTALLHSVAAAVIPVLALCVVIPWKKLRHSLLFIYLCITATMIPYVLLTLLNAEFPSIVGGLLGLIATIYFARKKWGLASFEAAATETSTQKLSPQDYLRAFFPFAAAVGLLVVTRIKPFGLQDWLTSGASWISFTLFDWGKFTMSSSLVLEIRNIFSTEVHWKHALLYVPSVIPFAAVALVCFFVFKISKLKIREAWNESLRRSTKPFLALLGAMVFVKLFMLGGDRSPAAMVGYGLAEVAGSFWNFAAVFLGALGAFFAGSCTISNLTFGSIQASVAAQTGMNLPLALSLQSVGGAMGNMICIHNIVAVCAVLGLQKNEGPILRKTFLLTLIYGLIVGSVSFLL